MRLNNTKAKKRMRRRSACARLVRNWVCGACIASLASQAIAQQNTSVVTPTLPPVPEHILVPPRPRTNLPAPRTSSGWNLWRRNPSQSHDPQVNPITPAVAAKLGAPSNPGFAAIECSCVVVRVFARGCPLWGARSWGARYRGARSWCRFRADFRFRHQHRYQARKDQHRSPPNRRTSRCRLLCQTIQHK